MIGAAVFGVYASVAGAYYVDSVGGNDANTGRSVAQAVQTIGRVVELDAAAPLNTWRLKRGSVWHEQLTLPRVGMTAGAYGTGAMPLLDASDEIAAEAWSKTAGKTNVYQATVSADTTLIPSAPDWHTSIWEDGARFVIKHSTTDVDATAGSYYPVIADATHLTVYVHASDGSDPGASGKAYDYAARNYSILCALGRCTLSGLWARRQQNANGSINLGAGSSGIDLLAEAGSKHNIIFGANSRLTRVIAKDGYFEDLGSTAFIGFSSVEPGGLDLVDCGTLGIFDGGVGGFFSHSGDGSPIFTHLSIDGWTRGAIAWASIGGPVTINNATVADYGIGGYDSPSVTVTNSSITNLHTGGFGGGVATHDAATLAIADSIVIGPGPGMFDVGVSLAGAGGLLTVTGTTISAFSNALSVDGLGSTVYSHGNVIDVDHAYVGNYSAPLLADSDNNTFTRFNSNEFAISSGAPITYSTWKQSHDANSTP